MELSPRFDFGRTIPWAGETETHGWRAGAGESIVYLRTSQHLRTEGATAYAEFTLKQGEQRSFALTQISAQEAPPQLINVRNAFHQTEDFWLQWCSVNQYDGPWKDAIERSLITLKALTYRPSGGIVAAPTTSLPERIGGELNWDYRFCWLRDASFTLDSLVEAGYHEEAAAWQNWLLQSVGSDVRQLQIMYGMRGERHLPECNLDWLEGYKRSRPVRTGNAASEQLQLDVYGETADALMTITRAQIPLDPRLRQFREELTGHVASIARKPASGIWEHRGVRHQYVFSKVMAWLTLEHGVNAAEAQEIGGDIRHWKKSRDRLHREICQHGFNRRLGSFVQSYHSDKLDASALLISLYGFLPIRDERIQGTIRAIEKRLVRSGLVHRYLPSSPSDCEGAFLACSFWLVLNLVMSGRRKDAERLYEKLLELRNDVGLLSEEYDTAGGRLTGNFPQALSHIALINAGKALAQSAR
ncbi:MAG TPA: glycoside hydrolase family 15 protein [Silvibacterium sp.]|nr:glycoside hydrolase family 15 protein [Silvibacterium sp.]